VTSSSPGAEAAPGSPPAQPDPGRSTPLARILWSDSSKGYLLWGTSACIFFVMLGTPNLWGHEATWALICREMMRSGDYFHPYLFGDEYYDKPLLSYWIMIACAKLVGRLDEWSLRLPGALAGLLTIGCTVRLGARLFGRGAGLMAGWMLASCFVFAWWARVATADILNIAAITGGVAWYFERRENPGGVTYGVFFLILAVGAQMKGLIAPVLTGLVLLPDLWTAGRWKAHLRSPSLYGAAILGAVVYLVPFLVSNAGGQGSYHSTGLGEALRESLGRYLHPFDHQDVYYVYAQYLPAYALPWTLFLPWVFWRACREWKRLGASSRWPLLASLIIFLFLTLGQSRRNYYILPILPFLVLGVADWIRARGVSSRWNCASAWVVAVSSLGMVTLFGAVLPYAESRGGARLMAAEVRALAEVQAPWKDWQVLCVSSSPHLAFYLESSSRPVRINADQEAFLAGFIAEHPRTVVVTPVKWVGHLTPLLPPVTPVYERSRKPLTLGIPKEDRDANVALVLSP
jgi:4-amino-4-deoxy-L-arabinose transferase-like glycosyltransferase